MSETLTTPERRCLRAICALLRDGHKPTISEVARRLDCGKSGAQRHMDALRAKGALNGPRIVGDWEPTRLGLRALEETP